MKELLVLLEERLVEHDESRKEVQSILEEICSKITKDADLLEEKISGEISEDYNSKEEEIFGLIENLNEGEGDIDALVKKANEELSKDWKYEIRYLKKRRVLLIHMDLRFLRLRLKRSSILMTLKTSQMLSKNTWIESKNLEVLQKKS